ncbi:MAG: hypothetical protein FWD94_06995, partial [Treponema sp.]|nr:hypothetical protein [Treponema sp.]
AGQVGSDNAPVPQKVTSTPSPRSVHAGNGRSLVIDTAGTLWTLEGNGAVELPVDARLSLVQLSFGGTVEDVSAGGRHDLVLIVFADNSTVLYARGANESGQLSNGSFDGNGYVTVPF